MLVLTRRVGETMMIGEEVRVRVLDVRGKQVRLGIQAPTSIEVHRLEIYEGIKGEQALANKPEQPS
jgi:carbon storage regulator